jgi:hypothetical protein
MVVLLAALVGFALGAAMLGYAALAIGFFSRGTCLEVFIAAGPSSRCSEA